jgi:hypothetical protein
LYLISWQISFWGLVKIPLCFFPRKIRAAVMRGPAASSTVPNRKSVSSAAASSGSSAGVEQGGQEAARDSVAVSSDEANAERDSVARGSVALGSVAMASMSAHRSLVGESGSGKRKSYHWTWVDHDDDGEQAAADLDSQDFAYGEIVNESAASSWAELADLNYDY